ncbi:hypothetical protein [Actinacidiphila cocklensis]|uniref:Uncharacterized protein n=1 Tax=Actinacidiphila cocklensis TaxID=887465 RepID=A0A9W4DNT0_9ACTN|nr:hypothetical protein [Actinacidiphila cocklensis]CAG6394852.1 hypothetical protein SCOCK_30085 [Actinacidiphila cocklensis]
MWGRRGGVGRDGVGARISAHAKSLAAAGPPPTPTQEIDDRRYALTDLLDDLTGCTDPGERLFICTELARCTAELTLAINNAWNGGGKWLARRLDTTAPGLSGACTTASNRPSQGRRRPWSPPSTRPEADSGSAIDAAARSEIPAERRHTA